MNSESQIQLRRYTNNLRLDGWGYIFVGIWNVLKLVIVFSMNSHEFDRFVDALDLVNADEKMVIPVLSATLALISLVILVVHVTVGGAAIRYSKGERKRKGFMYMGIVILLITILGIPSDVMPDGTFKITSTGIASVLVDLTACFILFDMILSTLQVDRFRRLQERL